MRRRIMALLQEHPEGLTSTEIRIRLGVDKSLADTSWGCCAMGWCNGWGEGGMWH
jgi:hypothetical protein